MKTSYYDLNALSSDDTTKDSFPLWKQLSDMVSFESQIDTNITKTQAQRTRLSIPFESFLNLIYTPSLNIWKDPFFNTIDTSLVGEKYIENNPYGDIALIQQWTNFFKDVGVVDTYNTINDIRVGQIELSDQPWFFSIPITVQFETPDKRSFLLLVNKLSMTAYIQNLSLINEFMYYLRETIKEDKADIITSQSSIFSGTTIQDDQKVNKTIWYLLYNRVIKGGNNVLITPDILAKSIYKATGCTTESQEECMYMFREKMRAIPYLAYGIWRSNTDIVEWFKYFFKNLPPILSIESFSFEQKTSKKWWTNNSWYKGTVSIRIYGKDLEEGEVDAISQELGTMCFLTRDTMNIANARARVEKKINEIGKWSLDTQRSLWLSQILSFFTTIETNYSSLSNYKKVIKLFEVYRTLKENTLCDIISPASLQQTQQNTGTATTGPVEEIVDSADNIVTGTEQRTIGDGKSKRDQELANEIEEMQQWTSF